jgi:hypothetical protein
VSVPFADAAPPVAGVPPDVAAALSAEEAPVHAVGAAAADPSVVPPVAVSALEVGGTEAGAFAVVESAGAALDGSVPLAAVAAVVEPAGSDP